MRILTEAAASELNSIKQQCLASVDPEAPVAANTSQSSEDSEIRQARACETSGPGSQCSPPLDASLPSHDRLLCRK